MKTSLSLALAFCALASGISHAAVEDRSLQIKVGDWTLNSPAIDIIAEKAQLKDKRQRICKTFGDKYPFAIIMDEAETEDGEKHILRWSMDVPNTCSIRNYIFGIGKELNYTGVYLYNTNSAKFVDGAIDLKHGTPMLYIVVLQNDNDATRHRDSTIARMEHYNSRSERSLVNKRLVIPSYSKAPNYKLLFIPHRFYEKMPKVLPGKDKNETTITWEDQEATIKFTTYDSKPTTVEVDIKECTKSHYEKKGKELK